MKRPSSQFVIVAAVVIVLCAVPLGLDGYAIFVLCQMGIAAIAALGMTILVGHGGLVSLGHAAMMAVGAYAAAVLTVRYEVSFWIAFPSATIITMAIGMALSYPLLRLSGPYLAVATLGLAVALPETLLNWKSVVEAIGFGDPDVFGGHLGLQTPRPTIGGYSFASAYRYWYVVLVCVVLAAFLARRVIVSRYGRSLRAFRESPQAAASFGINTRRVRIKAFAIAGGFAGLAGSLQAHLLYVVSPATYGLDVALFMLMVVVVGGAASVYGTLFAVAALTNVQEFLTGTSWNLQLVYGVLVALTLLFAPNGFAGIGSSLVARFVSKRHAETAETFPVSHAVTASTSEAPA